MKHKIIGLSLLCLFSFNAFAAATDDNEINIDQTGDTLTLYVDQYGYGNKIGLNDFSSSSSPMTIVGSSLTINVDQIGNENLLYGPLDADSSTYNLLFTGDSNVWDWNVGYGGSADASVVDVAISGNSNQFDIDWAYNASSERLNFDLDINTGSSNVWDINIDADDVTWDVDVVGSSNNFATTQSDGAYQSLTLEWIGSNGDIDILQTSGTCGTGISSCYGIINADFNSENAVVDIKQKDTGD